MVVVNHVLGTLVRCIGKSGPDPAVEFDGDEPDEEYWHEKDYEDERIGSEPGEFAEPCGVAVGHDRLYVSEARGRRLQVLTLEGKPLQVVPSPDGNELGGLCVDGDRIWCLGPHKAPSHVHIMTVA